MQIKLKCMGNLKPESEFVPCKLKSVKIKYYNFTLKIWTGKIETLIYITDYGLGGSGIESRCGRNFPPVQTGPGAHPASYKMGTVSSPGIKCGRGVLLTTHPLLVPRLWKGRAIPLPTLWATPDLTRENFTFIYIYIYIYIYISKLTKQVKKSEKWYKICVLSICAPLSRTCRPNT